ncbi:hypothetical protein BDZ94DRAFT_812896 [Collybia nuda]|uniref:Uncharacterized protein n=1 Tax=Collybia nuda TaxID=64659 RepID=A0A9P5Y341_9AGAR|nr:hypothetical protein BDZ94DRAFT_812896 [Collybia nuda]
MPTIIPQDILNVVVDHLANDRPTLKTCTLISRFFRYSCQIHLFGTLCLKIDEERRNQQLLCILMDHPALALCVQNLELQLLYLRWEPPTGHEHKPMVTIIPLLLHLRSLRMTYESNYMLAWKGSGELHEAVLHLFNLPTLMRLSLGCIQDFPIDVFLRRCTRLRDLTLTLVYEPDNTPDSNNNPDLYAPSIVTPKFQLDALRISTIQNSGRLLRGLIDSNSIGIQSLRKLEFGRVERVQDIDDCQKALEDCAASLEIFKVSVASETLALSIGNALTKTMDLSRLSRLRKLTLEVDASMPEALPWMHALLDSVSPSNNIEEVAIHDTGFRGTGIDLSDHRWSVVDLAIASWASPSLRTVSLVIGQHWEPASHPKILEGTFPGLSAKRVLAVVSRESLYSKFALI